MTADGADRPGGSPRFDVVLRGYDRRQVDEHIVQMQAQRSCLGCHLQSDCTLPCDDTDIVVGVDKRRS